MIDLTASGRAIVPAIQFLQLQLTMVFLVPLGESSSPTEHPLTPLQTSPDKTKPSQTLPCETSTQDLFGGTISVISFLDLQSGVGAMIEMRPRNQQAVCTTRLVEYIICHDYQKSVLIFQTN